MTIASRMRFRDRGESRDSAQAGHQAMAAVIKAAIPAVHKVFSASRP